MWSGWLTMLSYVIRIRSLIWWLSHPGDLAGVGISSGWLTVNSLCHPDDIPFHLMSSGWLNWAWYLIRMSYGSVIMSSGWDTLPVLSHPDEIANFDFLHHAVALQRFRRYGLAESNRYETRFDPVCHVHKEYIKMIWQLRTLWYHNYFIKTKFW